MNFVLGYAGIPSEVYDSIYAARNRIVGHNGTFISEPLRSRGSPPRYSQSHGNYFLAKFARLIAGDHDNKLNDTGIALIYVKHDDLSTGAFVDRFFPATLAIPVRYQLDATSRTNLHRSKNRLVQALQTATVRVKGIIPPIKKEITERSNATPLLLPIKNFESGHLTAEMRELQRMLERDGDVAAVLNNALQNLHKRYPRQRIGGHERRCFIDERDVQFHPPGSARHAFARPVLGHLNMCLISGRVRLGAPYDRVFHYDCTKGQGNIRELFYGCHEARSIKEGNPHLNIAPNDFVRGQK